MKKVRFTKMHGAGNDFVLIDDRDETVPDRGSLIAAMAADHTGIGCEGVILVRKSQKADFRMTFYNPDGTEAFLEILSYSKDVDESLFEIPTDYMTFSM